MKSKKFIIFGAAAILALTPALAGCANTVSAFGFRGVRKNVADGDTGSFTASITAKNTLSYASAPTGTTMTLKETYSTSKQMTSGNSQTVDVKLPENYYLIGLSLSMRSNASGGAGNLKINDETIIETSRFNTANWHGSWSTQYVTVNVNNDKFTTFVSGEDVNTFTIVISATTNSLYCESYTLEWGYKEPDLQSNYVVTFNSNGGSDVTTQYIPNTDTDVATKPHDPNPPIAGYKLAYWYLDDESVEFDFNTPITGNITLNAKWVKVDLTETFNISGALEKDEFYRIQGEIIATTGREYVYIQNGNNTMRINDPDEKWTYVVGNTLDLYGRYHEESSTKKYFDSLVYCDVINSDTVINQTPISSLDEVNETNRYKYFSYKGLKLSTAFGETGTRKAELEGSDVVLFYYEGTVNGGEFDTTNYAAGDFVFVTGYIDIYFGTKEIILQTISPVTMYTVQFETNGGTTIDNIIVQENLTFDAPEAPAKEQDENYTYTFAGWYSDEELKNEYDFNTPVTSDITLYAKWTETPLPVGDALSVIETTSKLAYDFDVASNLTEQTVEKTAASYGLDSNQNLNGTELKVSNQVSLTFAKNSGSNPIYHSDGEFRIYQNNSFTFSCPNGKITNISFAFTGTNVGTISSDHENYDSSTHVWAGESNSITFTNANGAKGARIQSFSVTYSYQEKTYQFTKVVTRFGPTISKNLWTKVQNQGTVNGFGVFVVPSAGLGGSTIKAQYDAQISGGKSHEEAITALKTSLTLVNYYSAKSTPSSLDEGHYYWNAYVAKENPENSYFTTNYTAVSYVLVDGAPIFMGETTTSVQKIAADLLELDENDDETANGSLAWLASLN